MRMLILLAGLCVAVDGFGYVTEGEEGRLLVANTASSNVVEFSQTDGSYVGELIDDAMLDSPDKLLLYDDALLISTGTTMENSGILKFDKDTGEYLETVASGGGLWRPYGFIVGDSGEIYVSSFLTDQILLYDGSSVSVFAQGNGTAESLVQGPNDIIFGQDGRLYLTTQGSVAVNGSATYPGLPSQVVVFDTSGAGEVFIEQPEPSAFGFVSLLGILQDDDGTFYVSDFANNIRVYTSEGSLIQTLDTDISGGQWVGNIAFGTNGYLFTVVFDFNDETNPGAILRWDEDLLEAPLAPNNDSIFLDFTTDLARPIGILALP